MPCGGGVVQRLEHAQAASIKIRARRGRTRAVDVAVRPVLTREKSLREAVVRHAAHRLTRTQGSQLSFIVVAVHQVVVGLKRDVPGEAVAV